MYPVSSDWDSSVRGARKTKCRVEVYRSGVYQTELVPLRGTLRADETSAVRRALTLYPRDLYTSSGDPLTPREADDLLAPFGTELKVWSGIEFGSGQTEWVPVITAVLTKTERDSWLSGLSLTAPDRSRLVALARFLEPYNVVAGSRITTLIRTLLLAVNPTWEVYDLTGSNAYLPSSTTYNRGDDRWEAVRGLAALIGAEVHVDVSGRFLIRPVPQVTASPVWSVDVSASRPSLLDFKQSMDAERVYNVVVAYSSAVGVPPISGYAYISSGPLSVAAIGPRPYFFSSPVGISSSTQAIAAASTILPRVASANREISPRVSPNRALDIGDTLTQELPGEESLSVVLSGFSFSLEPNPQGMDIVTRYPATVSTALVATGVLAS